MNKRDIDIMLELMITLRDIEKTFEDFDDEVSREMYNFNDSLGYP